MKTKKRIYFYGRFPAKREVGGVTTFTFDAASIMDNETTSFIDMWEAEEKKIPNNTNYSIINRRSILGILRILFKIVKPNTTHFFNFSNSFVAIFFFFIPKLYSNKWVVIFHNGEQGKSYENKGRLFQLLFKIGINKFDRVGYISELQNRFFSRVYKGNLIKISPLIKKRKIDSYVNKVNKNQKYTVLLSGFPTHIYRLVETLEVIKEINREREKIYVNICIYGEANLSSKENLTNEIERFVKENHWVNLYSHIDNEAFSDVMSSSSVYVRMNSEDSFGLVVAEAIESGIPAIATSVCERYPGTHLIEKDNFNLLKKTLLGIINGKSLDSLLPIQPVGKTTMSIINFSDFNE